MSAPTAPKSPRRTAARASSSTAPGRHRNALQALLCAKSIAVIGASEAEGSVGLALMRNLSAFGGAVYPVNPHHQVICGLPAYAEVSKLTDSPDLAIIATPAESVPGIVAECADVGVKNVFIISAGFREVGPHGQELEQRIVAGARRSGMRIIGPNCLGVMLPHLGLNASFAAGMARPGKVAFLSQSGALCTAVLDWSLRENVGFSAFVSLGSMADVGWSDLIDLLGDDPHTESIVCYMESVGDARAFLSAAREVAYTKPIIVLKVGRTQAAAQAAASHTGSLTGTDAVLDAAFRRVGVTRVSEIEELFDAAEVLAKQPKPRGPALSIVTNAGGPAALATDALVTSGGQLAALAPETLESLNQLLPVAWSHGNPIDILGTADADLYMHASQVALADAATDGLLVVLTPQSMTQIDETAQHLSALAQSSSKPVLASWMGGASLDAARAALNVASVPTYDFPDAAARVFALMWRHSDHLHLLYERPSMPFGKAATPHARQAVAEIISDIRETGRVLLTEAESKRVLAAYRIPTTATLTALTVEQAVAHSDALGYPVVLKLLSETITHKSDVGGVRLDLPDADAVRSAWQAIRTAVCERAHASDFLGVTVQKMVPRGGIELILGSSIDAQFGPVLLFGAGGEWVEVMKDRALGFPPLTTTLARRLIEETRIYQALTGARGHAPVDLEALAQLLVTFSHLVAEQPWISTIDINPLVVERDQFMALDARIVLQPPSVKEHELPRLAIRPYPAEYVTAFHLASGAEITLRPIGPADEGMLAAFHQSLSEECVRYRYCGVVSLDARTSHSRLARICFSDYDREMVLVAEQGSGASCAIVGVGRLNRLHGLNEAEFALIVADEWQGQGIGTRLMSSLIHIARAEKLHCVSGRILGSNEAMIHLCRRLGFQLQREAGSNDFIARLPIRGDLPSSLK